MVDCRLLAEHRIRNRNGARLRWHGPDLLAASAVTTKPHLGAPPSAAAGRPYAAPSIRMILKVERTLLLDHMFASAYTIRMTLFSDQTTDGLKKAKLNLLVR
jgi:hypothetical protein